MDLHADVVNLQPPGVRAVEVPFPPLFGWDGARDLHSGEAYYVTDSDGAYILDADGANITDV